jgi:hypothetical protein
MLGSQYLRWQETGLGCPQNTTMLATPIPAPSRISARNKTELARMIQRCFFAISAMKRHIIINKNSPINDRKKIGAASL